ncbi:MAG TPA: FecR family protein [Planctomycetota bacterium]|nr:FecR family protein [Planctomycetota bacterium]
MTDDELDALVGGYLEGALSAAERDTLLAELRNSPAAAERFKEQVELNAMLRASAREKEAFAKAVRKQIETGSEAQARKFSGTTIKTIRESGAAQCTADEGRKNRRGRFLILALSAAAMIVIAVLAWNWQNGDTSKLRIKSWVGSVSILRGGRAITAERGTTLLDGDTMKLEGIASATLVYPDKTELELSAWAELKFLGGAGDSNAKSLQLNAGTLSAQVTPQPANSPMTLQTPHALATVEGTQFELNVKEQSTRIEVSEGRVRFEDRIHHTSQDVGAGQTAEAGGAPAVPAPPAQAAKKPDNF